MSRSDVMAASAIALVLAGAALLSAAFDRAQAKGLGNRAPAAAGSGTFRRMGEKAPSTGTVKSTAGQPKRMGERAPTTGTNKMKCRYPRGTPRCRDRFPHH